MLRTLLIATALLGTSGATLAHGDYGYGRVIEVEPHIVFSFGSAHHDGFRVLVESGGSRYWTHTRYRPGHMIMLPPPPHARLVHYRERDNWDGYHDRHERREDRHKNRHKHRHHDDDDD